MSELNRSNTDINAQGAAVKSGTPKAQFVEKLRNFRELNLIIIIGICVIICKKQSKA